MRTLLEVGLGGVRSIEATNFEIAWWQLSESGEIAGVGFTVRGSRSTEFLTRSRNSPVHVWDGDGQVHVVHDLLARGMLLDPDETARFIDAWHRAFAIYQRSRRTAAPPRAPTPHETERRKDLA